MDDFEINKVFIISLLKILWESPEIMYNIIINSDIEVVKSNLGPFIVNNFYCNYLSGKYMENNLLYILAMLLKDEIDKLENINQVDNFLENTRCGFLLEELRKMPDIQIYFKKIIFQTVEKMERDCSFREINFNISEIVDQLKKVKNMDHKISDKKQDTNLEKIYEEFIHSKIFDPSINFSNKDNNINNNNEDDNEFMNKYVSEIKLAEFVTRAENSKKDNNNDLYEYFNKFENDIKTNNENESSIVTLAKNNNYNILLAIIYLKSSIFCKFR